MRGDRLLSIMLLLQAHQRVTARELAERLEVSERTIHRDMVALSTAGIPVYAERGVGGGWALSDAYRTDLTGLTSAEVRSLFLAKPSQLLADLGLDKAADAVLIKLLAALPAMQRRGAEYARERIHVDAAGWSHSREETPHLLALQEAIWQERKVRLTYRRGDGVVDRLIDPLGLVAKGGVWYVVAAVEGEARTYRVSRVRGAVMTEHPCARPDDFDLAAYWERSSVEFTANLPRYPVTVRVDPSILPRLHQWRFARVARVEAADGDGWPTVFVQCETEEEACAYALGFGPRIEVVAPRELREKIIGAARDVAAFYTRQQKEGSCRR